MATASQAAAFLFRQIARYRARRNRVPSIFKQTETTRKAQFVDAYYIRASTFAQTNDGRELVLL